MTNDLDDAVAELTLVTERLTLPPHTAKTAQAVADGDRAGQSWSAGFPREDDRDVARMVIANPPLTREQLIFGVRLMIERETGLVVGGLGFFGPPDEAGRVMFGYGVAPEVEGRGLTTEAVKALIAHGFAQPSVTEILAETVPTNIGSQRVLERAGLTRTETGPDLYRYARHR